MCPTLNVDVGDKKVELGFSLLQVDWLKPHEEIVYSNYKELYDIISRSQVFLNPIIVDSSSWTVLDGMHRVAVAKSLGLTYVPAMTVDYLSDSIRVDVWTKAYRGDVGRALRLLVDMGLRETDRGDCLIVSQNVTVGFEIPAQSIVLKYELLRGILKRLRDVFGEPTVTTMGTVQNSGEFHIVPPKLSKKDVVEAGMKHTLFPPKTTRHILKARIVEAPVPISLLKQRATFETVEKEFLQCTSIRNIKTLDGKAVYKDKYYDDDKIIILS
ncbi:hypothetical protein B9Q03_01310 [Candidatus Marsarchaeota G2 archaeon OSP_D]|uniref:ParB-like N-terminal domain-containing protein n=4 Tax=Candidatus Marsarchaeota group 2 TaxID=2203771 RepID=A0A2R6BDF5_9ARCH|nr:MAG: hypothetical protein B9Q03_01310 [Candidatus Marsarchaeota G2 archaeon OSP_D]PSN96662.1 MAG: hypothetical protein B9Q06_00500 [Candidatus Marsarchaeota G2 archaeon ECH_B_2]PSO00467.1 MAG: hypothetical protein B9Q07_03880 [Candidatus Marsarchaeota G2 archaeon ECH_B_3]PSO03363.1 MAG: hypothetical protein B9Q05_00500 [Candidatus Marsarchaeota G2 archaeon ECH_B_1]